MEKGINLAITKSLADFDTLLEKAIVEVSSKKLAVLHGHPDSAWEFQVGKYVRIHGDNAEDEDEAPVFWVGYGWEEKGEHESILWLEFDAENCSVEVWEKLNRLVGTSGKYYSKADFEFAQVYMNAWVHFYLREEYLERFYGEKADLNAQKDILTGFIGEILEKI